MVQDINVTFTTEERDLMNQLIQVRIHDDMVHMAEDIKNDKVDSVVFWSSDLALASCISKKFKRTLDIMGFVAEGSLATVEPPKPEPKAEVKPVKQSKPKAEKPKRSHDPSVLYDTKEDKDPTPRLAYTGKKAEGHARPAQAAFSSPAKVASTEIR